MMNNGNVLHVNECKCFSWSPIVGGALVAIGLSFLLNLFSVAIGLTAFTTSNDGVETLAFGGLLGASIGVIASMFAAGWIAGFLGQRHCNKRHLGCLYGFLTWCIALIIAIFITIHAQEYISFYGHFISGNPIAMQMNSTNNTVITATQIQNQGLVISAYIIFSLFFLSAFACTLGGHCGMRHLSHKEEY